MKLMIGVKALIVRDGRVLVIREAVYDEGTNVGKWDVPGGRINAEETLMDALHREVYEEVGLHIFPKEIFYVQENFPTINGESCHVVRLHYLAELSEDDDVILSSDHDQYEWVTPSGLLDKECVPDLAEGIGNYFAKAGR